MQSDTLKEFAAALAHLKMVAIESKVNLEKAFGKKIIGKLEQMYPQLIVVLDNHFIYMPNWKGEKFDLWQHSACERLISLLLQNTNQK